jgi:hypothetical protein
MVETFVRLVCPECPKDWEQTPSSLPHHRENFTCSACGTTRRLAEFMRTKRDLQTLQQFQ